MLRHSVYAASQCAAQAAAVATVCWGRPSQLAERNASRWLENFPEDFFDLIIVDEGHHNAAPSWQNVFARFPEARVISLTATPFRADEQPVEGDTIYRYTFRRTMQRGYIKLRAC